MQERTQAIDSSMVALLSKYMYNVQPQQQVPAQGQQLQQGQPQGLHPNLNNANLWNVLSGPGVPNPNL